LIRTHQADHHVKAGCLAGAVRSEETDDLAAVAIDIHSIHDCATAVDFHKLFRPQDLGPDGRFFRGDCDHYCGVRPPESILLGVSVPVAASGFGVASGLGPSSIMMVLCGPT